MQFLEGPATPTLRGAFREDDTDDEDDGDKYGRQARRQCHGAVDVWDALPNGRQGPPTGSSLLSSSDGSPEGPIANRWQQPRQGQAGRIRRGWNNHGQGKDDGNDGTGDT